MCTPLKVLIVEADHTSANQIKEYIETQGYSVVSVANNGMVALQALHNTTFDLAIVDFGLPNSWAETVLHALSKKDLEARMILLGQPGGADSSQLRLKYPKASYLPRPFSRTDLLHAATLASKDLTS